MLYNDIQYGNPTDWIKDMVRRLRFGMNVRKQKQHVGSDKIDSTNMPLSLREVEQERSG